MKFGLSFVGWATLLFIPAWFAASAYQHGLAAVAGHIVAPRGAEIEWVDIQLYYPFDLAIYVALCLASHGAPWPRRLRATAAGLPVLALLEVISLGVAMRVLMSSMGVAGGTSGAAVEEAQRLATAIIRVTGLVAAAGVWLYLLGRDALADAMRGGGSR